MPVWQLPLTKTNTNIDEYCSKLYNSHCIFQTILNATIYLFELFTIMFVTEVLRLHNNGSSKGVG